MSETVKKILKLQIRSEILITILRVDVTESITLSKNEDIVWFCVLADVKKFQNSKV